MSRTWKIFILVALVVVISVVLALKTPLPSSSGEGEPGTAASPPLPPLPRLFEFGADKCTMCKEMKPILEDLRTRYAGRLHVEIVNVFEREDLAKLHRIEIIPMQVFFDAAGRELYRHEGFMPKDDILAKWKELGFDFAAPRASQPAS